jgi:hypothetical protein
MNKGLWALVIVAILATFAFIGMAERHMELQRRQALFDCEWRYRNYESAWVGVYKSAEEYCASKFPQ